MLIVILRTCRLWTIVKDMAKVRPRLGIQDFSPNHAVAFVYNASNSSTLHKLVSAFIRTLVNANVGFVDWFIKAGPASSAIVFCFGTEQGEPADATYVYTCRARAQVVMVTHTDMVSEPATVSS